MNWKINISKYIVNDTWLKLRADSCKMPNGNIIEPYYVFEYPTWINILPVTSNNNVVLVKQYRHGIQEVSLEIPSGCAEENETIIEAAKRELLEETGYTSDDFTQTGWIFPNPANHNNKTYCFLAMNVQKVIDISLDKGEDIETVIVPFEKFITMFEENQFKQSLHVNSIYFGLKHLGRIKIKR